MVPHTKASATLALARGLFVARNHRQAYAVLAPLVEAGHADTSLTGVALVVLYLNVGSELLKQGADEAVAFRAIVSSGVLLEPAPVAPEVSLAHFLVEHLHGITLPKALLAKMEPVVEAAHERVVAHPEQQSGYQQLVETYIQVWVESTHPQKPKGVAAHLAALGIDPSWAPKVDAYAHRLAEADKKAAAVAKAAEEARVAQEQAAAAARRVRAEEARRQQHIDALKQQQLEQQRALHEPPADSVWLRVVAQNRAAATAVWQAVRGRAVQLAVVAVAVAVLSRRRGWWRVLYARLLTTAAMAGKVTYM